MAKAVISIENPSPSDWDLVKGIDSKLFQLLSTAGWKLANIDTESVKTFPDEGPAEGIKFETNNMPLISFNIFYRTRCYPGEGKERGNT